MEKIFFRFWRLLLFVSILAFGSSAIAQRTVTGVIMDGALNEPLIGGTVQVKGTTTGTVTDLDGKFSIKVAGPSDVIVVSYVGYETQEIVVGNQTTINLTLKESAQQLDELVVIGYGVAKKSDLTGAVAVVSSEDLTRTPAATFDRALQGKAAGVLVTQTSGKPGEGVAIRVRGVGSISRDPNPLYVVDGVVTGSISSINPTDIESMQVLKDASSAAIYGANGANGVVIITTKRGKNGCSKPTVSLSAYGSINRQPKKLDVMNADEYAKFYNEVLGEGHKYTNEFSPAFRQVYYGNGWQEGTDWQELMTQEGYSQNYNLSIAGGGENSNYSVSGGYYDEKGILVNTGAKRYNLRVNSDFQLSKHLKIGESLSVSRNEYQDISMNQGSEWGVNYSPLMRVYNPNNKGGYEGPQQTYIFDSNNELVPAPAGTTETVYQPTGFNDKTNPYAEIKLGDTKRYATNVLASVYAELKIIDGLTYKITPSVDLGLGRNKNWRPSYELEARSFSSASLSEGYYDNTRLSLENQLSYYKTLGKHTIQATAVHHVQGYNNYNIGVDVSGFAFENLNVISMADKSGTTPNTTGNENHWRMESYLGRFMYDYAGKYLVTASVRNDGVSVFSPSNRRAWFPSFSFGWKVNEDFLTEVDQIDMLKLRVGWGKTGNSDIPSYGYVERLTDQSQFSPVFGTGNQAVVPATYIMTSMASPDIRWEAADMTNFGVDLNLFRNKIQFSAEYYVKNQNDLLVQVPISAAFGRAGTGAQPWVNAAKVQNRGFEFNLGYRKLEGEFNYGVNANLTTIKNEVKYLPFAEIKGENNLTIENHAIGSIYGWVAERIVQPEDFDENGDFKYVSPPVEKIPDPNDPTRQITVGGKPSPGDLMYKDLNKDGVITDLDKTIIGKAIPDFSYTISFNCSYKNFDFSLFLFGLQNFQIYNQQRAELSSINTQDMGHNKLAEYGANYYRPDRPSTEWVRADLNNGNRNDRISTWFVEDASFLRVKDLQLGYSIPKSIASKANISNARIYVSAANLYTFTKYKGRDPEGAATSSPLTSGIDNGTYPIPKTFSLGVQLDF